MKSIKGIYTGLGATIRLGLGFVPDRVRLTKIGNANLDQLEWTALMARTATGAGGIIRAGVANTPGFALLAVTAGVRPYYGGDLITAAALTDQIPASEVSGYQGNLGGTITKWTLGSSANRTGCFNAGLDTAKCGVGSIVQIDTKLYRIVALTNDGDAANEVTLDRAAPTGAVVFIGSKVDFVSAPVGTRMPAGIEILDTTYLNLVSTVFSIEAWED
jgi:hypothetical protein